MAFHADLYRVPAREKADRIAKLLGLVSLLVFDESELPEHGHTNETAGEFLNR